jgi:hypothetical protein
MGKLRLKALGPWLREGNHVWFALSTNALAVVIALGPYSSEPLIRITGLMLQLLGIGTVIWGISETRAFFGHPSLASKTGGWLRRFPLLRRNVVATASCSAVIALGGKMRAHTTHAPLGPTLSDRVDALEKNIVLIHDRISETQKELDAETAKSAEALKTEEANRKTADQELAHKLESTATGGVHISAIGASWIFVGQILGSTAPEIEKYVLPWLRG